MDFKIADAELEYVSKKDEKLRFYIEKYGDLSFSNDIEIFEHIIRNIIGQMLSNQAANTIYTRFIKLIDQCIPIKVLEADDEDLRRCGISYSKIKYMKEIAKNVFYGNLELDNLNQLDDNEIVKVLSKQKGIGTWTAEMIALFGLGRKNIFSYDDVALKRGILYVHPEFKTLSKLRFEKLRKLYSPYCSVASLYYYHVNDFERK